MHTRARVIFDCHHKLIAKLIQHIPIPRIICWKMYGWKISGPWLDLNLSISVKNWSPTYPTQRSKAGNVTLERVSGPVLFPNATNSLQKWTPHTLLTYNLLEKVWLWIVNGPLLVLSVTKHYLALEIYPCFTSTFQHAHNAILF